MISYPHTYVSFLAEFHASRDFFECHELLEEYWKNHPSDPLADTWVGLIQLAVALYHERRGNLRGALKMYEQSEKRLSASPLESLGIGKTDLLQQIGDRIHVLRSEQWTGYTDLNMMIVSNDLKRLCLEKCAECGWTWGSPSPMNNDSIIHRHKLRDRSEVIAARLAAYNYKKRERDGLA